MKSVIITVVLFIVLCATPLLIPDDHNIGYEDTSQWVALHDNGNIHADFLFSSSTSYPVPHPSYEGLVTYQTIESVIADFNH